ncbi:deleted in malignant brain tumors 1 protein [Protobothrops mucrosquamatus]|uniref:deleted in malignant brain tumors 1 protein n=1 Tax=Protobothrops mucrosquamatus TaxID=103944 RepID=UPI000775BFCF|nr:deleted in malignant brain tumors 1 protein [Protobothrops mucrosquamatus]
MHLFSFQEKSLRLVNGEDKCSGRIEVFFNGSWGTICDDGWDMNDAHVVCRQLACGEAIQALPKAEFGEGTGSIFLDELKCKGNESSLEECSHKPWGVHNCHHKEDAGVICSGPAVTTPPPIELSTLSAELTTQERREKSLRLVNGEDKCRGRIEVFYNESWGTICDDGWDMNDAHVVCRQLACGEAIKALPNAAFGEGTGSIFLDELKCKGNESSLEECSHKPWGVHNCHHKEDAGVICSGPVTTSAPKSALVTTTSSLTVRLMNGKNRCQGRLEIFYNGDWGTVCDDGWDLQDAKVVCRQLACGEVMEATNEAYFGQGTGNILLENVQCKGNESSIEECSNPGWGTHRCGHKEDAGVICSETVSLTTKNPIIPTPTKNTSEVPVWALTTQHPTTRPVPAASTPHPIIPASKSITLPITQKHTPSGKCLYGCKLTGPSGSFKSPFYPSNYPKNSYCVWDIEVEERRHVELRFEVFRLEITRLTWELKQH